MAQPARAPAGRRQLLAAALLTVLGGLALAGWTAADWVTADRVRQVGGVPLTEQVAVAGTELAPAGFALGIVGALGALALPLPGVARRVVGGLLAVVGVAGAVALAAGVARALTLPGELGPAPGLAAGGALALVAGGLLATRRPSACSGLGRRYTVEGDDDREWRLASAEDGEDDGRPGRTGRA